MDEAGFATRLLAELSAVLGQPIAYAAPPQQLTGGFDTTVYGFALAQAPVPFDVPLVIRLFAEGEGHRAAGEAALQNAVAAQGYPAPRALHVSKDGGLLARPYLVMPRAAGAPLIKASPLRMAAMLADTHARLHDLDPAPVRQALLDAGARDLPTGLDGWLAEAAAEMETRGMEPLLPAFAWLRDNRPKEAGLAICHLDFHPLNLLADQGGVTAVIDWANAGFGDPAADVGTTRVLLTLPPASLEPLPAFVLQLLRRWLAWRYTRAYQRRRRVSPKAVRYYEALRCFQAARHLSLRRLAEARGEAANAAGYAWSDPATLARIRRRFRQLTQVPLVLPG